MATDDEDAAVGRECGGVEAARLGERACRAEGCRRRVPDLCRGEETVAAKATHDEDAAVGQECGGVEAARLGERTGRASRNGLRCLADLATHPA